MLTVEEYLKLIRDFPKFPNEPKIQEEYLTKYWLTKEELNNVWIDIMTRIFNSNFRNLRDRVFKEDFDFIVTPGSTLLRKQELELLQSCMKITEDKYFIAIEDVEVKPEEKRTEFGLPLRFRFPSNVSNEDIMSGGWLSWDVFNRPIRNFRVFGDSGRWGVYSEYDYEMPLFIIGFHRNYSYLFHSKFIVPTEDAPEEYVPEFEWARKFGVKFPQTD